MTSLLDVFGSSLSGSGMVALVFATGLPVWRLWARLVFLPLAPVCPDVEGLRLPPLPPRFPTLGSDLRGRVLSNPVGFLPQALLF